MRADQKVAEHLKKVDDTILMRVKTKEGERFQA